MRGLSLCAGIGGIDLGLKLAMGQGYRTVCYVEGEIYCASVLAARMQDGSLCSAPVWSDVKTFDARPWRGCVDIVTAGYPCQPFSLAGRRAGEEDPRHLWPYIARIIRIAQPRYVFCENVPGHVSLGLRDVRCDLQSMGYDVQAGIFSAQECGAPHVRERLFILAHSHDTIGRPDGAQNGAMGQPDHRLPPGWQQGTGEPAGGGEDVADANSQRGGKGRPEPALRKRQRKPNPSRAHVSDQPPHWWISEPDLGRLAHGVPHRVDQVRALGNAVVPAVACRAWQNMTHAINRQTDQERATMAR